MFVVVLVISSLFLGLCRSLSTVSSPSIPLAISGTVSTKDESRDFMAVFPDVVRDLTETGKHLEIPDATKWFAKVSMPVS
jgi:farnesyl diphosphate synthase